MTNPYPPFQKRPVAVFLLALVALMLIAGGCTSGSQQQANTPSPVAAAQTSSSRIHITYTGSPATTNLLELEATVTDSSGKTQTKSIGDRFSTTPLRFGATLDIDGSFAGNDRLLVTGYFMDGSQQHMLDTTI
ncbi:MULTISPECIES: hypothetical protein [unclassified Methanoregula]|uniref:hypothetical protein n=1 Tax=unclassified Methanoregula TaxID=2649730 RepID=UPI0009C88EA2|nr:MULTISPECIES: hypothetical protein [unclassified Methanoregula]OPX63004.1 MAG: hypothetical protein A4E33_01935 [Methanoregula sp. PtaB.Bin085]OPY31582.1 MAG: hypothetical protein A4E34_02775 [Methanoregula sp. PtaU1.Bin006]